MALCDPVVPDVKSSSRGAHASSVGHARGSRGGESPGRSTGCCPPSVILWSVTVPPAPAASSARVPGCAFGGTTAVGARLPEGEEPDREGVRVVREEEPAPRAMRGNRTRQRVHVARKVGPGQGPVPPDMRPRGPTRARPGPRATDSAGSSGQIPRREDPSKHQIGQPVAVVAEAPGAVGDLDGEEAAGE